MKYIIFFVLVFFSSVSNLSAQEPEIERLVFVNRMLRAEVVWDSLQSQGWETTYEHDYYGQIAQKTIFVDFELLYGETLTVPIKLYYSYREVPVESNSPFLVAAYTSETHFTASINLPPKDSEAPRYTFDLNYWEKDRKTFYSITTEGFLLKKNAVKAEIVKQIPTFPQFPQSH